MNEKIFSEGNLFNLNRESFFQMLSLIMRNEEDHFISNETHEEMTVTISFIRANSRKMHLFQIQEETEEKIWKSIQTAGEDGFIAGFRFAYSLISTMTK